MSTDAENIDIAKQGIEAFNNGDWDAVKAAFTADATYNEMGTGRVITGTDGIVEALQGWKTAFPDVTGTVTNAFASGDQVSLEISWKGTHTGPLETPGGTIEASGKEQTTPALMTVIIEGDKIAEQRHYFDMMTLLSQIDAL